MSNNNNNNNNNGKKRDFFLDGSVTEDTTRKIAESIIAINRYDDEQSALDSDYKRLPISLIVNTYGGNLYDANMLVGVIEISTTPVHTYNFGKAMSAGFLIFASGHTRFAHELATFMYHDASVGLHDSIEGLKESLKHYENLRDAMDKYLLCNSNLPKHIMDEHKKLKENWYISARDAHGYGLVDIVIPFRERKK
jgi:ATP-dependent Clp protease, protease subunit